MQGCLKYSTRLIRTDQCILTSPEGWKVCSDYVSLKIYLAMDIRCPWENDPGEHSKFPFYSRHSQGIKNATDTIVSPSLIAADVQYIFERAVSINYIPYKAMLAITTTSQFIINTFGRFFSKVTFI